MRNNYNQIEDFLSDESFVAWVNKTNKKEEEEWDVWMTEPSSDSGLAKEAAAFLQKIQIEEEEISLKQIDQEASRLLRSIDSTVLPTKIVEIKSKKLYYWAVAASVVLLLGIGIYFVSRPPQQLQIATNYGEIGKNKLPDGTEVILNANSELSYGKVWKEGKTRDVWIKGEAYFHVKKMPDHAKFIVHTDAFDIEVTGTSFNVINESGKSSIALTEGSVKIHRPGVEEIVMKPGDLVQFDHQQIEKKETDNQDYSAWTDNKLVFNNTPMAEVANIITRHYGISVKIEGDAIAKKTITGIMPNNNLGVLVQSLNATQEFQVSQTNDSIVIKENK